MIYSSGQDYLQAAEKRVLLFGMSGLGKTYLSTMLRDAGPAGASWFHYSVDYRIGTHYLGERIADMFKLEAMRVPLLRDLLLTDSVYIASNITFQNLAPLSTWLGKPGDPARGGLPFAEYQRRQAEHRAAEIAATLDSTRFIDRAQALYGYGNFVCDSSGSICEVLNPDDPADPVLGGLTQAMLLVWIEGSDAHRAELIRRFDRAPKPIYYQPDFLQSLWDEYLALHGQTEARVDPDAFLRYGYARLLAHRQPRYAAMARHGITVTAEEVAAVHDAPGFDALIAKAIDRKGP